MSKLESISTGPGRPMVIIMSGNFEFIITVQSGTIWKFNAWKKGGLIYLSLVLTSPDMTQPADNIKSITARYLSRTVS